MLRPILTICCIVFFIEDVSMQKFINNVGRHRDVITDIGIVRGRVTEGGSYFSFLGIPYASPPTGSNRFKAPKPPRPWKGIFEANRLVRCPQNGLGDEDCLIVNVFTPAKVIKRLLPVLVYIHGGSFIMGAGQTSGVEPLIKEDTIVVTVNHRLGALGFLCLGTEEAPGNAGLKDQVAALRWVKNNIKNFGGNPNLTTIYGMSAGGASVEHHILSNMSRGLFRHAIVESGSATSVWAIDDDPIKTASVVANITSNDLNELLKVYQEIPADELTKINQKYYDELVNGKFGFAPCIEKKIYGLEAFLTEAPYNILVEGKFTRVPIMFSFAALEGLYLRSAEYYETNYVDKMNSNFIDFLPADLNLNTDETKQAIGYNVKYFYFGNRTVDDDNIIGYLNYFGDYLILHGLFNSAEMHSKGGNNVYLMEFAYKGKMGSYEKFYDQIEIAGHGDVIKHAVLNKPTEDLYDKLAVARVAHIIANFVKYGNPTPRQNHLLPIIWPPVQPKNISCLHFGKELQIIGEPYRERKAFWDRLYERYRKTVTSVFS